MGTEMAGKWFWPHLKNGGHMAWKMGKMGRNSIFEPFSGHFFPFPRPFLIFRAIFPHFSNEAKNHISAIFVPILGRRPEMNLYQAYRIPNRVPNDLAVSSGSWEITIPTETFTRQIRQNLKMVTVKVFFSLHSCRSLSVNFIFIFIFCREIWRESCGIFLTHRTKAQKFWGIFRSIFRKKICSSKKLSCKIHSADVPP